YLESAEKLYEYTDFLYSLGMDLNKSGKVVGVLWGGPAFKAGFSPGAQIEAVNGIAYDTDRLKDTVKASPKTTGPIDLIVKDQDHFRVVQIDYHGGAHYPHLERVEGTPARLDDILAAK
ncbi:MAG: peptidase M61, partial [Stellaceae bacterium]